MEGRIDRAIEAHLPSQLTQVREESHQKQFSGRLDMDLLGLHTVDFQCRLLVDRYGSGVETGVTSLLGTRG